METQLTTTNTQVTLHDQMDAGILSNDLVPTYLRLMQQLSPEVTKEKYKPGEIVDTLAEQAIAGKGKALEFVPVKLVRQYVIKKQNGSEWEWVRTENATAALSLDAREFMEGGVPHKRFDALKVMVLLTNDLEGLPYVLNFKGMSFYNARKMLTTIAGKGGVPSNCVFSLDSELTTFNNRSVYVFVPKYSRASKPEEVEATSKWNKVIVKEASDADEDLTF